MEAIINVLMGAGALGAGLFCYVLSRRLSAFSTLESGMGGAIAVLSAQVDDMTRALEAARQAALQSSQTLEALNGRAELSAQRLELLLASLHDLPDGAGRAGGGRARVVHRRRRPGEEPPAASRTPQRDAIAEEAA